MTTTQSAVEDYPFSLAVGLLLAFLAVCLILGAGAALALGGSTPATPPSHVGPPPAVVYTCPADDAFVACPETALR